MERFKRTFSFRKKKDHMPEASKPHQWQEDEKKVREGTCSFQVRYLGCIEVFESRGIQVCEEAVKALKSRQHRSVWSRMSMRKKKSNKDQQAKGKYQRAVLYVSGDALRVVDEISKGLIVDQTIEKVSFCAPDRNHEKGFAYICRDGTTRRWMCHGFLAVKESGERMSHAVGCAFAVCLEKKQKREKEAVSVSFNDKGTSFTRMGSFRQTTLTERMADPQSAIIPEPVSPVPSSSGEAAASGGGGGMVNAGSVVSPPAPSVGAIERPRASVDMKNRQASFRGFGKLADNSPFKKQYSLRLDQLPSNVARQQQLQGMGRSLDSANGHGRVEAIPEVSPSKEQADISELCHQIEGLNTTQEEVAPARAPFVQPKNPSALPFGMAARQHAAEIHGNTQAQSVNTAQHMPQPQQHATVPQPQVSSNIPTQQQQTTATTNNSALPIRQTNPWETPPAFRQDSYRHPSPAETWLQSMSSPTPPPTASAGGAVTNGVGGHTSTPAGGLVMGPNAAHNTSVNSVQFGGGGQNVASTPQNNGYPQTPPPVAARTQVPPPSLQRANTVDNPATQTQVQWYTKQKAPTLKELQTTTHVANFTSLNSSTASSTTQQNGGIGQQQSAPAPSSPWSAQPLGPTTSDPFDAAWATKSPNIKPASSNPFQSSGDASVTQTFKVQL